MRIVSVVKILAASLAVVHALRVKHGKSVPVSLVSFLATYFARKGFFGVLLGDILGFVLLTAALRTVRRLVASSFADTKNEFADWSYGWSRTIPYVENMLTKEMDGREKDLEKSVIPEGMEATEFIPKQGLPSEEIIKLMKDFCGAEKGKWQDGKVSGGIYHGGDEHVEVLNAASSLYQITNPLHIDVWPSLRKFESDICKMTANLLRGKCESVVGVMTSGGTESIVLATRAHKLRGLARGITNPEIIICNTAHAAILKACEMFEIHIITVLPDPVTLEMSVDATRRAISSDTIMIYSSAPNFPNGAIDPISALSDLAVKFDVGLHVDCCLGGFVLPFAQTIGFPIPAFNFSCPGVTSMSVDTHKYGYAAKGSSVVLYRNKELRRYQYFTYPKWTGGLYCTTTIAGSRPGSIIASTWASMNLMGMDGYNQITHNILSTAQEIIEGIKKIKELHIIGRPVAMVVAFGSKTHNVYKINDSMSRKGWALNALQNPASIHLCCTRLHIGKADVFLKDLEESVNEVVSSSGGVEESDHGSAPIYGTVGGLPPGPVKDLLNRYLDVTLS